MLPWRRWKRRGIASADLFNFITTNPPTFHPTTKSHSLPLLPSLIYHKYDHPSSVLLPQLELLYQFRKRRQLLLLHQLELINKENKVLEAGVQVVLQTQRQNHLEVRMVYVRVYTEETLEDGLDHRHKIFGEGDASIRKMVPIWQGNKLSLLNWLYTQVINSSMYSGAGTFKGVFTFWPSAHRY